METILQDVRRRCTEIPPSKDSGFSKLTMDDFYSVWYSKEFGDGRTAEVVSLTFGRARIIVFKDRFSIDDMW